MEGRRMYIICFLSVAAFAATASVDYSHKITEYALNLRFRQPLESFGTNKKTKSGSEQPQALQSIDEFIELIGQSQDPPEMIMDAVTRFLRDERQEWMLKDIDKVEALLGLAYNLPQSTPPEPFSDSPHSDTPAPSIPSPDTPAIYGTGADNCLLCSRPAPDDDLCKACLLNAKCKGPMLLEIPKSHKAYSEMASRISGQWDHASGNQCPRLEKVFKVFANPSTEAQYETYRASKEVGHGRKSQTKGLAAGEELLWYETCHNCNLGVNGTGICDAHDCDTCSVFSASYHYLRNSRYNIQKTGSLIKAEWKVTLNRVVVGNSYELQGPDFISAETFRNCDSVRLPEGDRWMLYSKAAYRVPVEAVLPAYLVIFSEQVT
ncbi:hypothetical protein BU15DRAFT_75570 [Melanogaster broomeanus]|nr:hypothetical protein BU15DRAFT_75570 [Melanogaster broomeanus]